MKHEDDDKTLKSGDLRNPAPKKGGPDPTIAGDAKPNKEEPPRYHDGEDEGEKVSKK